MREYSGKTVLITGATGLIGSRLVTTLMEQGDVNVIALSRNEEKLKKAFSKHLEKPNFRIAAQDISAPMTDCPCVDFIFHAAGPMERRVVEQRPMDVIRPNVDGTMNCLDLLVKQKNRENAAGRLVVFSSVTVYGNHTGFDRTVTEADTDATDYLDSHSAPYSQSKRMAEVIALSYARQYGADVAIARLSTVYGPTISIPDTAFYEFIRKGIKGENIVLNNSGFPRRDNIFIDDAVNGLLTVGARGEKGEAYNISSNADGGNYAAVDEIAGHIAAACNKINGTQTSSVICGGKEEPRKGGLLLDNRKLRTLGWKAEVDIQTGIERTIADMMKSIK